MDKSNEEKGLKEHVRTLTIRHRGRGSQVAIYLGKMLRMFVYQSDWKVLPMASLIAGLVGLVIRRRMFVNMEGTLMGSFALVCVCIWNGCFNSIQVICRERDVIKREHRSGMHISSYIVSHMIYQALLCIAQTVLTLYVISMTGVEFPSEGLFSPWLIVDLGISMVLISYASDMLSLWVSALSRSSTTAMTIMPFVLIFQLVFSGGMLTLPQWSEPFTHFTISNPGLKVIAAQSDINNRPFVTITDMMHKMRNSEVKINVTLGQALDTMEMIDLAELADMPELEGLLTMVKENPDVQAHREDSRTFTTTVGQLLDVAGEDEVNSYLEESAAKASYKPEYENTKENINGYWMKMITFIFAYAFLAMITLEFIDKDKR